ncbi:hypothetical protein BH24PSE1_BH24PSE1_08340 [soil metagenome]
MRFIWTWAMAAIGLGTAVNAQGAPGIDVMVLGTYHFDSPGLDLNNPAVDDVLKPQRQVELEALAAAIAEFRPTKVMVERVSADLVDPKYPAFGPAALKQNRDERAQIAYRIARRLGHSTVYAIDEQPSDGEPDYFPFGKIVEWAKANGAEPRLNALMVKGAAKSARTEELQKGTIPAALAEINAPAATAADQSLYYEALSMGDAERQPGADLNAMWYLRNAKIFAKLQQVAKPGDRVLVVYGSGHNYWLRHFAMTAAGYRNVDPTPYLERAAAAR